MLGLLRTATALFSEWRGEGTEGTHWEAQVEGEPGGNRREDVMDIMAAQQACDDLSDAHWGDKPHLGLVQPKLDVLNMHVRFPVVHGKGYNGDAGCKSPELIRKGTCTP